MTEASWRDQVVAYIRAEAQPPDKFGHQPRLYALCTNIGHGLEYDDDVVFAAAWMHDLGVFLGHRPKDPEELAHWDHVPYTIDRSRELLKEWGFPAEKLGSVADAIRSHQAKDEPTTVEATILRDADMLEQLGAIGIMRALAKVGRDTRYPSFTSVLSVIYQVTNQLPGRMRLITSKAVAERRVGVLRSFIAAIEEEAGDLLY